MRVKLFLALFLLPLAHVEGDDADWVITGHETCDEPERIVSSDIRVTAGGILDLRGCMIVLDTPPYEQRTFDGGDRGLKVQVDADAELRMTAINDQPAGFRALNSSYKYTIQSQGLVTSHGVPGTPNEIRDLGGRHQGQLVLGGFQSSGEAQMSHTWLYANAGPSLWVLDGGTLQADNLTMQGMGSLAGMKAGHVDIVDLHIESVYSAVFFTHSENVDLRRCDVSGITNAVISFSTPMRLEDCHIAAQTAVSLERAAEVAVTDSTLAYNTTGVLSRPDHKMTDPARANTIVLDGTTFRPGDDAQGAIGAILGTVNIKDSSFHGTHAGAAVQATRADVRVEGSRFLDAETAIRLQDPRDAFVEGNEFAGDAVSVHRSVRVLVLDHQAQPVNASLVDIDGMQAVTGPDGSATVEWKWFEAETLAGLPWPDSMALTVQDPQSDKRYTQTLSGDAASVQLRFHDEASWRPLGFTIGLVLLGGLAGVGWTLLRGRWARP